MNGLEELARRSSDALRETVDTELIPDFRARADRTPMVGAVIVLIVVVIGGAAWLGTREADDLRTDRAGAVPDTAGPDDDPAAGGGDGSAFRLGWARDGFEFGSAAEWAVPFEGDAATAHTTLYGRGSDEAPYGDADLLVTTFVDTDGDRDAFSGEEIPVRGGVGYRDRPGEGLDLGLGETIAFYEGDDVAVILASRSMTVDDLLAVAEGLTFDRHIASVALSSLSPLVHAENASFAGPGPGDEAWWVGYLDDSGANGVTIGGWSATADDLLLQRYLGGAEDAVPVRGTIGWATPDRSGLMWLENGDLVTVRATGVDPSVVAAELTPIDGPAWRRLLAESPPTGGGTLGDDAVEVARGVAEVGGRDVDWSVLVDPGRSLCLQTVVGGTACGGMGPQTGAIENIVRSLWGDAAVLGMVGTASSDVARIVLEWPDGRSDELELTVSSLAGRPVFGGVVERHEGAAVDLVAYDAEGVELARRIYPLDR